MWQRAATRTQKVRTGRDVKNDNDARGDDGEDREMTVGIHRYLLDCSHGTLMLVSMRPYVNSHREHRDHRVVNKARSVNSVSSVAEILVFYGKNEENVAGETG